MLAEPLKFLLVMVGLYLTGGCANALNQLFERDIDKLMQRTSKRRPLPTGRLTPRQAMIFSISIGIIGVTLFAWAFNWLTALLSLGTILFYSLVYTLLLKPNTAQNIVIGGAAGAMAPIGAWAAATGEMALVPWLMFLLVFLWTPPHFWALALFCKDDYVRTKLPMMPVVKGETSTLRQILWYSIGLVLISLVLALVGSWWFFLAVAMGLGIWLLKKTFDAIRHRTEQAYRSLFGCSIVYLFGLFSAIMIDVFAVS
jgi:protoheme IX farnesyltransferase